MGSAKPRRKSLKKQVNDSTQNSQDDEMDESRQGNEGNDDSMMATSGKKKRKYTRKKTIKQQMSEDLENVDSSSQPTTAFNTTVKFTTNEDESMNETTTDVDGVTTPATKKIQRKPPLMPASTMMCQLTPLGSSNRGRKKSAQHLVKLLKKTKRKKRKKTSSGEEEGDDDDDSDEFEVPVPKSSAKQKV